MRFVDHVSLGAAARLYAPLAALFAFSLFAARPAGAGVGFIAGLAFALVLVLHVLVFGSEAARRALPAPLARALLGLGLIAAVASAGLQSSLWTSRVLEAGLFATTVGGCALILAVLVGRAPTLRDEDW